MQFSRIFFQDFPGPWASISRTFQDQSDFPGLSRSWIFQEKKSRTFQDFPGGVGTLTRHAPKINHVQQTVVLWYHHYRDCRPLLGSHLTPARSAIPSFLSFTFSNKQMQTKGLQCLTGNPKQWTVTVTLYSIVKWITVKCWKLTAKYKSCSCSDDCVLWS